MASTTILNVIFNLPMHPDYIKAFRSAVSNAGVSLRRQLTEANLPTDIFHNHDEADREGEKRYFRYPLVQYRFTGEGNDKYAALTGIGDGAQALRILTDNMPEHLSISGRDYKLRIIKETERIYTPKLQNDYSLYAIDAWLALNADNYTAWHQTPLFKKRIELLERILKDQVGINPARKNATGLLGTIAGQKKIKGADLFITEITRIEHHQQYMNRKLYKFEAAFAANINLPENIGIGSGTAFGFGNLRKLKVNNKFFEESLIDVAHADTKPPLKKSKSPKANEEEMLFQTALV